MDTITSAFLWRQPSLQVHLLPEALGVTQKPRGQQAVWRHREEKGQDERPPG